MSPKPTQCSLQVREEADRTHSSSIVWEHLKLVFKERYEMLEGWIRPPGMFSLSVAMKRLWKSLKKSHTCNLNILWKDSIVMNWREEKWSKERPAGNLLHNLVWEWLDWVIAKDLESGLVWTSLEVGLEQCRMAASLINWASQNGEPVSGPLWTTYSLGHARFGGKRSKRGYSVVSIKVKASPAQCAEEHSCWADSACTVTFHQVLQTHTQSAVERAVWEAARLEPCSPTVPGRWSEMFWNRRSPGGSAGASVFPTLLQCVRSSERAGVCLPGSPG